MTSIKYDHLQVMGTITGKFHQNPLKTVGEVAVDKTVWEETTFEEFQDGRGHLRYQNGMILAILNLSVTVMPPIKFHLNLT